MTGILQSGCREIFASKLLGGKQMQIKRGDLSLKHSELLRQRILVEYEVQDY